MNNSDLLSAYWQEKKKLDEQTLIVQKLLDQLHSLGIDPNQKHVLSLVPSNHDNAPIPSYPPFPYAPINITRDMILLFMSYFRGREEFFAKRTKNGGYYRPCANRFDSRCPRQQDLKFPCKDCTMQAFVQLNESIILDHLLGRREDCCDVVGVYPITSRNTCWFIVYDFDDKEFKKTKDIDDESSARVWHEVGVLAKIFKSLKIPYLLERSRSGQGAHLWVFFAQEIDCAKAIRFGDYIKDRGLDLVDIETFSTFDRMFPMQSSLKPGQAGNLIALPLQGRALRHWNSTFIDPRGDTYLNPWKALYDTNKVTEQEIDNHLKNYHEEVIDKDPTKPWDKNQKTLLLEDVVHGLVEITRANGIFVLKEGLKERMRNRIRMIGVYDNPEYYKKRKLFPDIKNTVNPRFISCVIEYEDYICLPRGTEETLVDQLMKSNIKYSLSDKTEGGRKINATFIGTLRPHQTDAINAIKDKRTGIIAAATAFGKTVVAAAMIAKRKTSTLILVDKVTLMDVWYDTLLEFLDIEEEIPEYTTKTGRVKKEKNVIGRLGSHHSRLHGIIDIAMVQSIVNKIDCLKGYGMVLVDECHHAASPSFQKILETITSRYVHGFTATPKRYDAQDAKMIFQLGEVRYRFTASQRAQEQHFSHYIVPRFTSIVYTGKKDAKYTDIAIEISLDEGRNQQIVEDVIVAIGGKRTSLILVKYIQQSVILENKLKDKADHVINISGKTGKKHDACIKELHSVTDEETLVLISTGEKGGEGFNYPRLDTLFLACPVSWEGRVEQYAGRLDRDYPGKKNVMIYDYVDDNIPMLESMYKKRLKTYRAMSFKLFAPETTNETSMGMLYDGIGIQKPLSLDIMHAKKTIVIFSPYLSSTQTKDKLPLFSDAHARGIRIMVITAKLDAMSEEYRQSHHAKEMALRDIGVDIRETMDTNLSYAIIDSRIVYYGTRGLLSRIDEDDDFFRLEDATTANALLEKALAKAKVISFRF